MRARRPNAEGTRTSLRRATTTGVVLTLGISLVLPNAAAAAATFPDVPADSPHLDAIEDLVDRGAVLGKADGTFGPADLLTRGQLASILARALGLAPRATGPFTDVSGTHAGAINALAESDIILGRGDGTFAPNGTITRDQVASMVARLLELEGVERDAFDDVPADNVHRRAINALAELEVALGDGVGNFGPRRDLRRDQSASFVARALAILDAEQPGPDPDPDPDPDPACPELGGGVADTAVGTEVDGFTPSITVSEVDDLAFGDTVTVTGSGFDPTSDVGTRPPLAGQPAGVYVDLRQLRRRVAALGRRSGRDPCRRRPALGRPRCPRGAGRQPAVRPAHRRRHLHG